MPREGAIIFRDLAGKLEVINVECDKCGRRGSYRLDRLIERRGIDAKLFRNRRPVVRASRRRTSTMYAARGVLICRRWCETPLWRSLATNQACG
jgi:hypothetical protein